MNDDPGSRAPRDNGADPEYSLSKTLRGWLSWLRKGRNGDGSVRETLEELIEEFDKCQLLCEDCHRKKTHTVDRPAINQKVRNTWDKKRLVDRK